MGIIKKRLVLIPVLFLVFLTGSMVITYYVITSEMNNGYTYGNIYIPPETYICLTEDEKVIQHYQIFYKYDLRSRDFSDIYQEITREQKYVTSYYYVEKDGMSPQQLNNILKKRKKYLVRKKDPFSHPAFCGRNEYVLFQLTKGDDASFFHKYLFAGLFILLTLEYLLTVTLKIDQDVSWLKKVVYYSITIGTIIILFLSYWFYFIASHLG